MIDKDKVLAGMAACTDSKDCEECPYDEEYERSQDCMYALIKDMAELIDAQEPRVLTTKEMQEAAKNKEAVYVEGSPEGSCARCFCGLVVEGIEPPEDGGYNYPGGVLFNVIDGECGMWDGDFYGLATPLGWRAWTSRPTDEQRKAVKWDD